MAEPRRADPLAFALATAIREIAERRRSSAIWDHLEAQPGFSDRIDQGQAQIARGEKVTLREAIAQRSSRKHAAPGSARPAGPGDGQEA